ncbi:glycosyltransferase family 2 protein [Ilumatobacter nonamiensis]|uniref:glycosyltransferase family 2 protein n=1 Tax=Ilumatobacter nonamiensis TaxID=467093 RepID=UPI000345E9B4|nr:glycosyltransferase family 2 protein [Ilumatobacter nonamiensis]
MEPETLSAPPVVAVVVVHEPGDWFEDTLDACADQDYPNLRFVFLVTESAPGSGASLDEITAAIGARLPDAFVRSLGSNPGFARAANDVTRLVDGENGFFLFCHDDIAPDRDAVRLMVEELYRSNAGVVGPKIVEWDDPGVLRSVGLGLDRFGEIDQQIEPGEVDQEQHDGVRDVFVLPTSCMLVRADLFRELGGFDEALDLYGEDVEFCWRVHHSGARVVVAPSARVRHRGLLPERRPDLHHVSVEARHRLRAVATLTGASRLPLRLLELLVLTVAELVVGLFTGRFREGVASLTALIGLVPRIPSILARRRAVAPLRRVPEREVLGLQQRGSSRMNSYLRRRETSMYVGAGANVRRWKESSTAPVLAWIVVLALVIFGSRSFLSGGVPAVGEFLQFPASPRDLLERFASGWNPTGTGATASNPTGMAAISLLSVTTLFRMGLLHTLFIVGLVIIGLIGLWKLATVFPSTRARIAALVVYAASPLVSGSFATGSLGVLVTFAAVPWVLHAMRRCVGVETADPRSATSDLADGVVDLSWAERLRRVVQLGIVVALASAFAPVMLVISVGLGLVMVLATLVAMAPVRTALLYLASTAAGVAVATVLSIPWIGSWSWDAMVGPPPIGDPGRGLRALASFEIGPTDFVALTLALYLPVVAALLLARAWRLTWAVRASALVLTFGALAVFGDRGSLPFPAPTAGILLVPVAVGLALSAAASLAAFDLDVRGGSFGWRQPLGIAASIAVAIGVVPGALAVTAGDWDAPTTPLSSLIEARLPAVPENGPGDYHVLLVGDARLLPIPGTEYRDGISFAVMSDDDLDVADDWPPSNFDESTIIAALDQIADGSTQRAGRLLAPLGIRFIVVPEFDSVNSTPADPMELPIGLVGSFDEQLDIVSVTGLPAVEFFENTSWIPTYSLLTGPTAEASRTEGDAALVRADLTDAQAIFSGTDAQQSSRNEVLPGVVHLGYPYDENWKLEIDGEQIESRVAFGVTTAFDVEQAGVATLSYSTPSSRTLAIVVQALLWLIAGFVAARVTVPTGRRRSTLVDDETLISLHDDVDAEAYVERSVRVEPAPAGIDPGLDMTGEIARTSAMVDADESEPFGFALPEPDGSADAAGPDSRAAGSDEPGDVIDELPWVDELMHDQVDDPISVHDDESDEREDRS